MRLVLNRLCNPDSFVEADTDEWPICGKQCSPPPPQHSFTQEFLLAAAFDLHLAFLARMVLLSKHSMDGVRAIVADQPLATVSKLP